MLKVLIVWLWSQWIKYLSYFKKNNYDVSWLCKTIKTKNFIEKEYFIDVFLENDFIDYNKFDIIIISLPPDIQWEKSINILKSWYKNKLIIEIPVTWNIWELNILKKYDNVFFFLEEYYTLLAQFLRKLDINKISNFKINVFTSELDYINEKARKVTFIHINNNFLWTWIDLSKINYEFNFHNSENIFYKISFKYDNNLVEYNFFESKYLKIWEKIYIDNYNFDKVLSNLLLEKINFNKYYSWKTF